MQGEKNVCIIPAAGRGIRFSRDLPKSFYPIEGRTLLARSIAAVAAWGGVSRFVVMVLSGMEDRARETLAPELEEIEYSVHAGGETRQESVARGLAEVGEADLVLVHDASRPVFSVPMVERIVKAAREYGAAVPVLQVTDSIARIRDEAIESAIPRDRVVGIQTPQAFRLDVLRKAFEAAEESGRTATDESSLVLAAGFPVRAVEGERWNIKVTYKEDVDIVRSFLVGARLEMPTAGE
ncbi:MAG: 2-C-methyl-D-erythritol 4-phosphate cytidylyltransferase [Candidatus Krumholzibacteriota bacterium]|nr:2-C-methyl-D-erythritol 4-phosphate cytidylyltransferase [Candidatus Krumholzibacteriota bacterium]